MPGHIAVDVGSLVDAGSSHTNDGGLSVECISTIKEEVVYFIHQEDGIWLDMCKVRHGSSLKLDAPKICHGAPQKLISVFEESVGIEYVNLFKIRLGILY